MPHLASFMGGPLFVTCHITSPSVLFWRSSECYKSIKPLFWRALHISNSLFIWKSLQLATVPLFWRRHVPACHISDGVSTKCLHFEGTLHFNAFILKIFAMACHIEPFSPRALQYSNFILKVFTPSSQISCPLSIAQLLLWRSFQSHLPSWNSCLRSSEYINTTPQTKLKMTGARCKK